MILPPSISYRTDHLFPFPSLFRFIYWEFVSNSLAYINLRTERTGFSAIRELLPGTCLCFDGVALSVEPTWLPGKHILCQRSGEVAGIANELQRLIINCTAAWSASRSDRKSVV